MTIYTISLLLTDMTKYVGVAGVGIYLLCLNTPSESH